MHELKRAEIVEAFGERVKELGWIGLDMATHPEAGPFAVRSLFEKVRHPSIRKFVRMCLASAKQAGLLGVPAQASGGGLLPTVSTCAR